MKKGKHFVVLQKLQTKNINGNVITDTFDISEISKEIGDVTVDEDASHIKYENENVFLVLVCKENNSRKSTNNIGNQLGRLM